ncbi:hypothetical protein FD754_016687, partial [Muntiacus muntjak]
ARTDKAQKKNKGKVKLKTFQEYGDTGEIWFGEVSMTQLIRWMQKHKIPLDASVFDIGAGNGVFLVSTWQNLVSLILLELITLLMQYSFLEVLQRKGLSNIKLKGEYFLNPSIKLSGFYICIDKGTSDAISFNPDNAIEKRKQYVKSLSTVLKVKGFFLTTLCDWTKEEGMNSVKDLNSPKSCQHPSSALEVDLERVQQHWFSKTHETFHWTDSVSF